MENKAKKKNRRWDAVVVGIGMALAFSMIIMKITGYWPCRIATTLHIKQVSCDKSIQENTSSIIHWIQIWNGIGVLDDNYENYWLLALPYCHYATYQASLL